MNHPFCCTRAAFLAVTVWMLSFITVRTDQAILVFDSGLSGTVEGSEHLSQSMKAWNTYNQRKPSK